MHWSCHAIFIEFHFPIKSTSEQTTDKKETQITQKERLKIKWEKPICSESSII